MATASLYTEDLALRDATLMHHIADLNAACATITQDLADSAFDIASLTRVHEKVIVALATLQSSVQDLSRAYINHANTVLNPGRSGTLDVGLTNTLVEAGLLGRHEASLAVEEPAGDTKKKRKRAKHDPNAPKRALTPYFLYMQTARANIARELGPNAKPKEVADEGTRRWSTMKEEDKMVSRSFSLWLSSFPTSAPLFCFSGVIHVASLNTLASSVPCASFCHTNRAIGLE
jgi:hypothetical protein